MYTMSPIQGFLLLDAVSPPWSHDGERGKLTAITVILIFNVTIFQTSKATTQLLLTCSYFVPKCLCIEHAVGL